MSPNQRPRGHALRRLPPPALPLTRLPADSSPERKPHSSRSGDGTCAADTAHNASTVLERGVMQAKVTETGNHRTGHGGLCPPRNAGPSRGPAVLRGPRGHTAAARRSTSPVEPVLDVQPSIETVQHHREAALAALGDQRQVAAVPAERGRTVGLMTPQLR